MKTMRKLRDESSYRRKQLIKGGHEQQVTETKRLVLKTVNFIWQISQSFIPHRFKSEWEA